MTFSLEHTHPTMPSAPLRLDLIGGAHRIARRLSTLMNFTRLMTAHQSLCLLTLRL
jgi:hypothetical protein